MLTIQQFNSFCDAMVECHRDQKASCVNRIKGLEDQAIVNLKKRAAIVRDYRNGSITAVEARDRGTEWGSTVEDIWRLMSVAKDEAKDHDYEMEKWKRLREE